MCNIYIGCVFCVYYVKRFLRGGNHKQHNLPVLEMKCCFEFIAPVCRLCCSVCIFEGLCVMSEGKVWFFSKSEWF